MESFKSEPIEEKRQEDKFDIEKSFIDENLCVHLPVVMQKIGDGEFVDEYIEFESGLDLLINQVKEKFEPQGFHFTGGFKFQKNDKGEQEYVFSFESKEKPNKE